MSSDLRFARLHGGEETEHRSAAQRDRDRVLYSSAFRRLSAVTQVLSADEGFIFHNRLTHSLKVGQVGRRIAEKLVREQADLALELGVDPDVVEAAGLAHDLGHPPFGHIAEKELDRQVVAAGLPDGFEGNAQSFRIVTKLAVRSIDKPGLNLTRATLNAILKYPWHRETDGPRTKKWGAYHTEKEEFRWAREGQHPDEPKSAEAEIMDWSDDIAYSVHDVEDFYRAGVIPLDRLATSDTEITKFLDEVCEREALDPNAESPSIPDLWRSLTSMFPREPYLGRREQRAMLRTFTSRFTGRYVAAISLHRPTKTDARRVEIVRRLEREVFLLKQLTKHYAIATPALATQQYGLRRVIGDLFRIFREQAMNDDLSVFPSSSRMQIEEARDRGGDTAKHEVTRIVADLIASMTEQQALRIHQKLTGIAPGSGMDSFLHQSIS